MSRYARVIATYENAYPDPISGKRGDLGRLIRDDTAQELTVDEGELVEIQDTIDCVQRRSRRRMAASSKPYHRQRRYDSGIRRYCP